MKTILSLIFVLLCFYMNGVFAQNHFPVISMEVISTPIPDTINGHLDISDTTLFEASMKIIVWDTISISKLNVSLKKDINSSSRRA